MGVAAIFLRELAFAESVVDTGISFEVMRVAAFTSSRTVVLIVEFLAGVFFGLGTKDLATETVREVAVEAVLAVAGEIVDTRIETSIDMLFAALLRAGTLLESEVLVATVAADALQLGLELFELEELFVVHQH